MQESNSDNRGFDSKNSWTFTLGSYNKYKLSESMFIA